MLRTLLVPVDGSPFSEQALTAVDLLAERTGAALRLARVHVSPILYVLDGVPIVDTIQDPVYREHEQAYLDNLCAELRPELRARTTCVLLDGAIGEALVAEAAAQDVDLVAMTTHGRGGLARAWLGSIADRLVHHLHVPLLLLRPREPVEPHPQPPAFKQILVPLDGSTVASRALGPALELGRAMKAEFTLMQVVEPLRLPGYAPVIYAAKLENDATQDLCRAADEYLESLAEPLRREGLVVHTRVVLDDRPAQAILAMASSSGSELIAMATHGHGGVVRWLIGSVADKVVRAADVPVLLYRPPEGAPTMPVLLYVRRPERRQSSRSFARTTARVATMKRQQLTRYAWLSILAGVTTIGLKAAAYAVTGSVGLLSDALESVVNLVAALVALVVLVVAARPADAQHAYGHSKAEYFSSSVEGILILVAALGIGVSAIQRLYHPRILTGLELGLMISTGASLINLGVARILLRVGRTHDSIALEADGHHLMTDVWTSIAVIGAVGAVALTGWEVLDPIIALAVAANIVVTGVLLVQRSVRGLLDTAVPAEESARIQSVLDRYRAEGIQTHALRTRQAGVRRFVSLHVLVPGAWTVKRGHVVLEAVERDIRSAVPHTTVFTHLEPVDDPESWEDMELDRAEKAGEDHARPRDGGRTELKDEAEMSVAPADRPSQPASPDACVQRRGSCGCA